MTDEEWEVLDEVPGLFQAELLRGLLEAQEIPAILLQEGAGRAIGLTVGPLGVVQILVPINQMKRAADILDDYYAGRLAKEDTFEDKTDFEQE